MFNTRVCTLKNTCFLLYPYVSYVLNIYIMAGQYANEYRDG